MAQRLLKKFDLFFDALTIFLIISGGVLFHLVTVLAIKSMYGLSWAVAAFILPGVAEIAYAATQFAEQSMKYPLLLLLYMGILIAKLGFLYGKVVLVRALAKRQPVAEF